jgi:hypothetical protein
MSESMEKSRQATSGWRRISFAAISALFAFILARLALRARPALPEKERQAVLASPRGIGREARRETQNTQRSQNTQRDDDAFDRQIRLRMPVTMANAPSDFTAQVLARIATAPAPQMAPAPGRRSHRSWLRSLRIAMAILSVALLLMLATGIVLTLVSPSLAVAILDAVISGALALLAAGRALGRLLGDAAATPWMIPAALGGLLGFLLLSWAQLARQFGRDPQEA